MKRKTVWLVLLMEQLKADITKLQDFIKLMKPPEHKKKHEWLLTEVLNINTDDIRIVCRNTIQLIKDLQVMDMYRYYTEWLGKPQTLETIEEAFSNIQRSKRILCPQSYHEDLKNYPHSIVQDPNFKQAERKKSTKKADANAMQKLNSKLQDSMPPEKLDMIQGLFNKLIKKHEYDESLYSMDLKEKRLVALPEIVSLYKK